MPEILGLITLAPTAMITVTSVDGSIVIGVVIVSVCPDPVAAAAILLPLTVMLDPDATLDGTMVLLGKVMRIVPVPAASPPDAPVWNTTVFWDAVLAVVLPRVLLTPLTSAKAKGLRQAKKMAKKKEKIPEDFDGFFIPLHSSFILFPIKNVTK